MASQEWTCTSCTFINQTKDIRCQMCHGHRPRSTMPNKFSSTGTSNRIKKRQSTLIDLVGKSDDDNDDDNDDDDDDDDDDEEVDDDMIMEIISSPPPQIASTDSARKKRRKKKMLASLLSSSSSLSSSSNNKFMTVDDYDEKKHDERNIVYPNPRNGKSNRGAEIMENDKNVKMKVDSRNKTHKSKHESCTAFQINKYHEGGYDHDNGKSNTKIETNKDKQEIIVTTKKRKMNCNNTKSDYRVNIEKNTNYNNSNENKSRPSSKSSKMAKSSTISSSTSSAKKQKNTSSSSKVQRTLFGAIIENINQTNEKDLSHDSKKNQHPSRQKTKQSSSSSSSTTTAAVSTLTSTSTSRTRTTSLLSSQKSTYETASSSSSWFKSNTKQKLSYDQLYSKAIHNLQTIFKIKSLRNLQPKAIKTALQLKSQIIVMATGGGKSLCYQLPATVLDGVTIVVSPLIALMVDQIQSLREKGIEAVSVSSMNGVKENNLIMKRLLGGDTSTKTKNKKEKQLSQTTKQKPIKLVYCTPELIQTVRFRAVMDTLYKRNQFSLFAIDEAHCLSIWGQDFRPAYRKLSYLRSAFPDIPLMACTATATEKVIEDIREVLCLNNGEECYKSSFNRKNIHYEIRYKDAMGDAEALQDLIKVVIKEHKDAEKKNQPCSGIVYVHKRDDTNLIASEITKSGIPAAPYHAGLKDKERKEIQSKWTDGTYKVAVATVAFGMGIDLAHVRYVLHWSMSKSVEGFYQESGRAGRDGLQSKSILYYSRDDASKFQFLIQKNAENKRANDAKKGREPRPADNLSMEALMKMIDYCNLPCCRRKYLLSHFGEKIDAREVCQKTCDYCIDPNRMDRAMEKGMAERAKRDVMRQQNSFKNAKVWNGTVDNTRTTICGYESNDGENYYDSADENDDGYGLGITQHNNYRTVSSSKSTNGFQSAKSVLSHYEAMECAGQKNGFVTFKKSKPFRNMREDDDDDDNDNDDDEKRKKQSTVKIPAHIRDKMEKLRKDNPTKPLVSIPKEKGSKQYQSEAEKVRAELAAIKKQQEELMRKKFSKS